MSHTPGPWTVYDYINDNAANVYEIKEEALDGSEATANARVISAAPDLLNALTLIADALSNPDSVIDENFIDWALALARPSIHKATGETK